MFRFFLTIVLSVLFSVTASPQGYEPNTKWPYVFENFQDATIYFKNNSKAQALVNVHLWKNCLHHVNAAGKIMEYTNRDIVRIEIAGEAYFFVDGKVMKVEAQQGESFVMSLAKGDFNSLTKGTGAYGASLNSSATTELNSLDLGGLDKPELGRMEEEKNQGRTIPVTIEYYFIFNGNHIRATKTGVSNFIGKDRSAEFKSFCSSNKIKWKDVASLQKILSFLIGQ